MKQRQPDNELIMARRIFGTIYDFAREAYRRGTYENYKRFIDNIRFTGICFDCSKSDAGRENEKEFHAFMKKCVASKVKDLDPHFHDYEGGGEDRIMELF